MGIFTNKDLEQFGNVINTLINELKKNENQAKENTNQITSNLEKFVGLVLKNQQQVLLQQEHLDKTKPKPAEQIKSIDFELGLKKVFNQKVDKTLEEVKFKYFKKLNTNSNFQYSILIIILVALLAFLFTDYKSKRVLDENKIEALKYKLLLKLVGGTTKKMYLKFDSTANTYSLKELEEQLNKTEGK